MPNEVFEFLHGKPYIVDGLSGVFKHRQWRAVYPFSHMTEKLDFVPDEQARQSEAYLTVKQQLGDNWDMDLTQSIEVYCQAATNLGFVIS